MNRSNTFDCLIVGSGAGGAAAAYKLAMAGLRVGIIEKGRELPRDASTLDFTQVVQQARFKSKEPWRDGMGRTLVPEEYFNVGGKTRWYGAALLRYARHEFEGDADHQCRAWPFGYDEIAPYYDEAEQLLDVRAFDVEPDLRNLLARLCTQSPEWRAEPLQLGLHASILADRIEASHFDGFASVAGLKSDAETAFLSRIRPRPNVTLMTGATVTALIADPSDPLRVAGVQVRDGTVYRASAVILAAGALHSPRLLQRFLSRTTLAPQLPIRDLVGRNLKLHLLTAVVALSASRKTDLVRKTTVLLNDALPHSSVQPLGFDGELIGALVPRLVPRSVARQVGERSYGFFLQTEDGSHPDNRVIDAGSRHDDASTLDYDARRVMPALAQHLRLVNRFRASLAKAGMLAFSERIGLAGTAHASGTLVTGSNPLDSAVDAEGAVHGLQGLYVADGSVLPRSSRVNPSLTIYAWSLRLAERLAQRLQHRSVVSTRAEELAT